ncbi:hypothetical protein ACO2Q8_26835 [Larkinella sp. VNQ87]|uniref:hypothetical protein n=1 Tax=Larkinella sp. VNQ87 TaxID=3400921 RepID=UPI003C08BC5C
MRQFRYILAFLLPFWGSAVLAQTGMAVFGNCSVAEKTVIVVTDEQLTLKGDITGDGQVVMAGKDTQTVVSSDRSIGRLVVANRKAVKVKGRLTVRKSMVVTRGDLVVEPDARLTVSPGAFVVWGTGSWQIGSNALIERGDEAGKPGKQPVRIDVALPGKGLEFQGAVLSMPDAARGNGPSEAYLGPDLFVWELPPWNA